jgi:uncharacterized protein (DUF2249 family)
VRPIIAAGREPLAEILDAVRRVPEDGALVVEAPFDPAPLRGLLGRQGFTAAVEQVGPDHWRVYFRRTGATAPRDDAKGPRVWRESDGVHIDVRGLPPPEPMVAVLRLLERPGVGDTVFMHHDREPLYLYPELAERGWEHQIVAGGAGEVRLRLMRERR